jgi:hypothetical protein
VRVTAWYDVVFYAVIFLVALLFAAAFAWMLWYRFLGGWRTMDELTRKELRRFESRWFESGREDDANGP